VAPWACRESALHSHWESERRYRGIVENAAEGIWAIDGDRRTTYVNNRMAQMLGLEPGQMLGRPAREFLFAEDLSRASVPFHLCLDGQSVRFDFRLRHHDSGEVYVSAAASPVFDADGRVTGVVGLLTDVTTRELVENQLQRLLEEQEAERAFLQTLLDSLPVAVGLINARDFRYRFMNEAMQRIFRTPEKLTGQRVGDLFPDARQAHEDFYRRVITSRQPLRLRAHPPLLSGYDGTFWDADYLPVFDEAGNVASILIITQEVTDQVLARQREHELRAEAERRAGEAERGRQRLEVEAERRAALEERLRRSNQDLLQFAYVISHDLQEPMRNVASFSRLLTGRYRGTLDARGEEFLEHILASAERMRQMIDDLLVYSRVAHDVSAALEAVEMEDVLAEALANLERGIAENQAVVTHDPLPPVRGDFGRLTQLLQNLIGNAIKYRSAAPPRIHVSAARQDALWLFSIADNGVGIEPRYADQIFGVFRRLHGREFPGTGIGLAIARQIVERHGGRIWVESDGATGSSFRFTLPPVA
jgi:PAS domain S-box-containing protein